MDLSNHNKFKIAEDQAITPYVVDRNPLQKMNDATEILQLALENASGGVWEMDLVTKTVQLCPQSLRMIGLPDEHSGVMTQEEWLKLVDIRDVEQFQGQYPPQISLLATHFHEFRIQRADDGESRWLRVSGRLLPDQNGQPTRLLGLQFDDTNRKRADEAIRESEERLRLIQEAALIGTFITYADHRTIGSKQFYSNLGLPEDRGVIEAENHGDFVHPDDLKRVKQEMEIAFQTTEGFDSTFRIIRADTGEVRWIFARTIFERAKSRELIQMVGAHLDITETKRAEAALQESVALNQSILEASIDCMKLISTDSRLLFMNTPGLAALEVEDASNILGKNWVDLWPLEERHKVKAALQAACAGQTGRFNGGCPTATGKPKWWDVVVTPIRDEQGQTKQLLAVSRDITKHRENLAQIRWTASHDMLTELPNRRYFQSRLEKILVRAATQSSNVGLLQLDVDDFKRINDALGHDAGDALLQSFSKRLQRVTRGSEIVARLGGDEFAIIIPDLKVSRSLSSIIADIQAQLAEPFIYQGHIFDCQASIGKAIYPQHGETVADLLKSSDIALYAAKNSGRGNVRSFRPSMRTNMQKRLDMIDQARTALREDRIFPFYQPKIHFGTGALAGFEALLRWQDSKMRIRFPAEIAAAFEDLSVAQALSERMLHRVLADMRHWLDDGIDFGHVAINASAAEFRQNDFAERLLDQVKTAGIPINFIELEVTETVFLGRGADYVGRALHLLSAEGMQIALDDFGTGFASLSHLKQFPVDIIKIDQSFVRNINIDPDDSAIIKALIGLGKSLSIRIVAEGIENLAQSKFLADQGCDYGQGYLFSKAVATEKVPELILRLKKGVTSNHHFAVG